MWRDQYHHIQNESGEVVGVMCGLSIMPCTEATSRVDWVTKWDGSDETNIEGFKGGISKAFVRAAVKWGIGRYLYRIPETWAKVSTERMPDAERQKIKTRNGEAVIWWSPPDIDEVMRNMKQGGR
jgi:hypothetical protein